MAFCTYCGQSFTRDEHLERHILTHTNVKPFKCFTCHMSFARKDILQRHYTVHGRNQNNGEDLLPQGIIPKSAGRTPIACGNCAKTKTKCDKKFPCSRCAQRNLKCTLRPTRRASKGVQRISGSLDAGAKSRSSSDNRSHMELQNTPGGTSPAQGAQAQQANVQSSPQKLQQPSQMSNSEPPSQRQSQSLSVTHSRNPYISQPVQPLSHLTPEDKTTHIPLLNMPPFFNQSPTNTLPLAPSLLSPLPTPVNSMNSFISSTPMSGYDDFVRAVRDQSKNESTQFIINPWSTIAIGSEFSAIQIDPSLAMSVSRDISMGSPPDSILGKISEMSPSQPYGPVRTPIQAPRMDESFSDLQIGNLASMFYPARHSPIADAGIPDLSATIAAQDSWTVFCCTPSIASSSCPRTPRLNLERLGLSLKNHDGWGNWSPPWDESDFQQGG
ncbi:hypothetical protein BKA66DRAFT_555225 [Pyrenochaeta sp. MPI-SDFR-AT-0127]|nr:hypothetical protein BKA66DRAFT_555225 [Pyrenochaeta sp. MPI-SDFR-AT-0127]